MSETAAPDRASVESLMAQVAEEFLERLDRGERPEIEAYAARYPQVAAFIRQMFPALEVMRQARLEPAADADAEEPAGHGPGCLGDFCILREVGRGGMGVVYEAEQLSLKRRVALKVLPFAATLDPRQLQRFHNEAQAAAHLHHQHIVPVHAVGCERGVHYYAMQFIDGHTLAGLIADLRKQAGLDAVEAGASTGSGPSVAEELLLCREGREAAADLQRTRAYVASPPPRAPGNETLTPAAAGSATERSVQSPAFFRAVARLGVQAAEALEHAHQLGVVHRDIKPANLLVDGRANLWITDFGLAHCQSQAGLTMSGDLVGTLRYMSPEQALAKRVVVDHRTDIYSLGATLYELLTLEPAFPGNDRQELLRQIAFEEPRPPRRLNSAIPAELETIVLEALEKNPNERYGTAQEMADDLGRFLRDEPIRARRPTLLQRARKWARRHRPLVGAAAVVLLLAAVLGGGNWVWWAQKRAVAEGQAREALREATGLLEDEQWPEALSAARRAEGVLAGVGADPGLVQQAHTLIVDLEMVRRLQEARLVGIAVKLGYEETHTPGGPVIDNDFAMMDDYVENEAADAAYTAAFTEYRLDVDGLDPQTAAEQVRARSIQWQLVAALDDWALARKALKRPEWGQRLAVARAADPDEWRNRLRDYLEGNDPKALEQAAAADNAHDWPAQNLVQLGRLARGTTSAERVAAVLVQEQRRYPGDFWINEQLGLLFLEPPTVRPEEAFHFLSIAVALRPKSAGAHYHLAIALDARRRSDEAIAEFQKVIRLRPDWAEAHAALGLILECAGRFDAGFPYLREAIRLKPDFAEAHFWLGRYLGIKGNPDEAIAALREALRLNPGLAEAHHKLGIIYWNRGRPEDALREARQAIQIKMDYPQAHNGLGIGLQTTGKLDEAIAEYQKAIRIKGDYFQAHFNRGNALYAKGQLDGAITEYRKAIRLAMRLEGLDWSEAHSALADVLAARGQLDEALRELETALCIKLENAEAHCTLGRVLQIQGQYRRAVEEYRLGHEYGSPLPYWPDPSGQWVRDAERLADLEGRLPALLNGQEQPKDTGERLALAQLYRLRKQVVAAARLYGDAFHADPALGDDLSFGNRYNAACVAALAGCGNGTDAGGLSDQERGCLRNQAREWLRADLEATLRLLEERPEKNRSAIARKLANWLADEPDFAGVRGNEALASLPEPERVGWQNLWQDVEALRQRAAAPPDKAAAPRP
jgi:serine/threonine protein kinase/Flp pilus assembly protein TadD